MAELREQTVADYVERFHLLARRFLRIAEHGTGEAEVDAASVVGGQLLYRATKAGLMPVNLWSLESADSVGKSQDPIDVWDANLARWTSGVQIYSIGFPETAPTNPLSVKYEDVGMGCWRTTPNPDAWRIRAENFAEMCRYFAALIGAKQGQPPVADNDEVSPLVSERMVFPDRSPFSKMQGEIMKALDGRGLTKENLAAEVSKGDSSRMYDKKRNGKVVKKGELQELMDVGYVKNKRRVGYYRPDRPPTENHSATKVPPSGD